MFQLVREKSTAGQGPSSTKDDIDFDLGNVLIDMNG